MNTYTTDQQFKIVQDWGFMPINKNDKSCIRELPFNDCDQPTHRECWSAASPDTLTIMDLKNGTHEVVQINWSLFRTARYQALV